MSCSYLVRLKLQTLLPVLVAVLFIQIIADTNANARSPNTLRGDCRQLYNRWLKMPGYGAFASSKNGFCNSYHESSTLEAAIKDTLRDCKNRRGAFNCKIIATNNVPGKYVSGLETCANNSSPYVSVSACNWIIESGKLNKDGRAWAYAQRGYGYMKEGKFETAAEDFERSLVIKKDYDFARVGLDRAKSMLADIPGTVASADSGKGKSKGLLNWFRGDKNQPAIYDSEDDELAALSEDAAASTAAEAKVIAKKKRPTPVLDGIEEPALVEAQPEKVQPNVSAKKASSTLGGIAETVKIEPTTVDPEASWVKKKDNDTLAALAGTSAVNEQIELQNPIAAPGKTGLDEIQTLSSPDNLVELKKLDSATLCGFALDVEKSNWRDGTVTQPFVDLVKSRLLSVAACRTLLGLKLLQPVDLTSGPIERRIALVLGNNKYRNFPDFMELKKAVNDARLMRDTLQDKLGFEIIYGEDVDFERMKLLADQFVGQIKKGDIAFIFYSGHGVSDKGATFMLPGDVPRAKFGEEERVIGNSIDATALTSRLVEKGARIVVVVLDACRDDIFTVTGGKTIGSRPGLSFMNGAEGVFIMYSAATGQAALDRLSNDDPNPNSLYTRTLVPLLSEKNLTLEQIAKRVKFDVAKLAESIGEKQRPAYYNDITDDVVLNK
jgi:Caspase domain